MEGKAPQHAYELGGKQGLGNESVGSGFFCRGLIFSRVVGRDNDNGNVTACLGTDLSGHLDAVHVRHTQIHDDSKKSF